MMPIGYLILLRELEVKSVNFFLSRYVMGRQVDVCLTIVRQISTCRLVILPDKWKLRRFNFYLSCKIIGRQVDVSAIIIESKTSTFLVFGVMFYRDK